MKLDSKLEDQRKRLRLDEKYQPIPSAEPELTAEQSAAIAARHHAAKKAREGRADEEAPSAMTETSIFHGTKLTDYQGRSWLHPPAEARQADDEHECFIPKKWCVPPPLPHRPTSIIAARTSIISAVS